MNLFDYAALGSSSVTTFMLPPTMRRSFRLGRVRLVPASYYAAAQVLSSLDHDVAFAHVAPPDAQGLCSYGIASDFTPLIWDRARTRIALVNEAMPSMPRGPRLSLVDADIVVRHRGELVTAPVAGPPNSQADAIAARVAQLIPDGAAIQTGIGAVPSSIWPRLVGHRGLLMRSGMCTEGFRLLHDHGALAPEGHTSGIAYGDRAFYDFLASTDQVQFATTLETHRSEAFSSIPCFHSINSALEVDLFGQISVEWQGGSLSGGIGGGIDFMRAAACSPGGRSIIALPSTAKGGAVSRVVPRITALFPSTSRTDIDTVVTEHGCAELHGLDLDKRAEALNGIAAPDFKAQLRASWLDIRNSL
jgi:acyl-CoA hydrolase